MNYLPETLPTIERLGLAFDEMDLDANDELELPPASPAMADES
jgi:hypothetical protein